MLPLQTNKLYHFYFVVRAGGIHKAGKLLFEETGNKIDASTLSRSVTSLEEQLRAPLIEREPFLVLPLGHSVYRIACDVAEDLSERWRKLTAQPGRVVHLGASEFLVRAHLVELAAEMHTDHGITLQFHHGTEHELICGLMNGETDLAITGLNGPLPDRVTSMPVVGFDPVLLVRRQTPPIASSAHFLRHKVIKDTLVRAASTESVCRVFAEGLRTMSVEWPQHSESSCTALVTLIVAASGAVGLSMNLPKLIEHPDVTALPLPGFAPVVYGPLWREGADNDALRKLRKVVERRATELWPKGGVRVRGLEAGGQRTEG